MAERVSSAERIRLQNVAEEALMRFHGDHALWHKHVHNVTLDPLQLLKMVQMDRHLKTVDFSCRRTGKTAVKELYLLEQNACLPDQEVGIVAPREAQARVNLAYHQEAIRRSEILTAYLARDRGRSLMADTYYQFVNRSRAQAFGIMANVDGGDLTTASLEEVDDMPHDRLYSRFLLMLGSNRRLGADENSRNNPQIRITGVYKGADTLAGLVASGQYHVLPTVDVYLGIQMGILNEQFMQMMREELPPEEYVRQLLCRNVASRNLIWAKYLRQAMHVGMQAGLQVAGPLPGKRYKRRGLISFGYDAGGHGEDPHASKHALVVCEQIGNFVTFPYARTWKPGEADPVVKNDLKGLWRYFRPDYAIGDAYGVGMLTTLNDELFADGLTDINRMEVGDGDSTASTWPDWAFSPMRFEGMTKHQMAQILRAVFHNGNAALPPCGDDIEEILELATDRRVGKSAGAAVIDIQTAALRLLARQLLNIRTEKTGAGYPSYKMVNRKVGDDLFDAAMAAVFALATRGEGKVPTVVTSRTQTTEQLLAAG